MSFETQLFIPLTDNQAQRFIPQHHAAFEAFVVERFGGYTRYAGDVEGVWQEAGITYHDSNRVYGIKMDSILQGGLIGEVVEFAKAHYRQKAILIRYLGQMEIL